MNFKKIAIFGLGLLGGSICRDVKKISPGTDIVAYGRHPEKLSSALNDGTINKAGDIKNPDIKSADLIIVASTAAASIEIINNVLNNPDLCRESIVIDVGSVKGSIIREIEKNKRADRFVGCHPMAGSEKTGYENSREALFRNASVIITPNAFNNKTDIEKIADFWKLLNARTLTVSAEMHDSIVAYTSHLPHMASCLIVDVFNDICADSSIDKNTARYFIGSGFRDVTRIASSSAPLWTDISILNHENISKSIGIYIDKLVKLKKMLDSGDNSSEELYSFFERIKNYKQALDSE